MNIRIGFSPSLKIRGVLAEKKFSKGEIIETCPVILIPIMEIGYLEKTILVKYYFDWNKKYAALSLGYGSLYNHSDKPNSVVKHDYKNKLLNFYALRDILPDTEITHDYGYGKSDLELLDFNKDIV